MAKWEATGPFQRRVRNLTPHQRTQLSTAISILNALIAEHGFAFPKRGALDLHIYQGFQRPPTVWSMDVGKNSDLRVIFTVNDGVIVWHFVGTHDEIHRWQTTIGPKGLRSRA